jgi:hypothetical protein
MVNPFIGRKEERGTGVMFTHRRFFSSHRSRDTRPSFNYELSLERSSEIRREVFPVWIVPIKNENE